MSERQEIDQHTKNLVCLMNEIEKYVYEKKEKINIEEFIDIAINIAEELKYLKGKISQIDVSIINDLSDGNKKAAFIGGANVLLIKLNKTAEKYIKEMQ